MISADFVALSQFFEGEDLEEFKVHPQITGKSRFTLLTDCAVRMRSLGRLRAAKKALRTALEDFTIEKISEGYDGAYAAAQLSELELISGELMRAEKTACRAIDYADKQDRTYLKFHARNSLADVLMQKGDMNAAGKMFEEAKYIADRDPDAYPPFFYSQGCYRYGLYLVETGREDELIAIAKETEHWGKRRPWLQQADGIVLKGSLLSSAIDQMILAEAMVRRDERDDKYTEETEKIIVDSVTQLKESGYSDYLARGLNIAARYYTGKQNFKAAFTYLEQNREHVRRGDMRLLHVDYLCEMCRYHLATGEFDAAAKTLESAVKHAEEISYGRCMKELELFRDGIHQRQSDAAKHRTT
jgi:tetratricopeptide (TPR) repeat protein